MRSLVLIFVLSGLASGCSTPTPPRCNPTTCSGCCDGDGKCQAGTNLSACGPLGGTCVACLGAQVCSLGFCREGAGGGPALGGGSATGGGTATGGGSETGGGSTTGGGPATGGGAGTGGGGAAGACNSINCVGCCNGDVCELGNSNSLCGSAGAQCIACGSSLTCQGGTCAPSAQCSPSNCSGCCASGVCQAGTAQTACGGQGTSCVTCGVGTSCQSQQCRAVTPPCRPGNCAGCCDSSGTCHAGTASTACGLGGTSCTTCSNGLQCSGGTCASTACGFGSCGGCCDSAGTCQAGTETEACGTKGQSCEVCQPSQACTFDGCATPAGNQPTGAACTKNDDCAGSSDILFSLDKCIRATQSDGGPSGWVNGYCSPSCLAILTRVDCPDARDYCDGIHCWQPCTAPGTGQSNCRVGYVCASPSRSDGGVIAGSAHCQPNCHNAGWSCSGQCTALGYCD